MAIGTAIGIPFKKSGQSWSSYWTTLISAIIEDANPDKVVLTYPTGTTLLATDYSIPGKTISGIELSADKKTHTLTVANFPFLNKGVYTVSLKGLTAKAITNNITHTPYPAVGDIIEISHSVTYADGQFDVPLTVSTFFFVDNGLDMTAYHNGVVWVYFYVNYGKIYNWYAVDPSRTGGNSFTSSDTWAVATSDNYNTLLAYLGTLGITNTSVADGAGNHLKSRRQTGSSLGAPWDTTTNPYWGASATHVCLDTFKFGGVAGGARSGVDGSFANFTLRGYMRTSTLVNETATVKWLRNTVGTLQTFDASHKDGFGTVLVRSASEAEQLLADGTVVDVYMQNNGYPVKCVKIGTQVWTSIIFETKWRDGTVIPFEGATPGFFSNAEWAALTTPGVCSYNNNVHLSFYLTYSPLFDKYANNPIITKGVAGTWDGTGIRDPLLLVDSDGNMVKEDGKYIMYYNGRDPGIGAGDRTKIGRATSVDMITWVKEATNPVFADGNYTAAGCVVKRGTGDYIMYYAYDGSTKFNFATSVDGLIWVKNEVGNPIMEIADFAGGVTMALPNVVEIDGVQYMVFELYISDWQIYMMKSTNWVDWELVGKLYTPALGYFDSLTQANPSLYKIADNYFILIYNGQKVQDSYDLAMLHSNNVESGWKKLQNVPVLYNGADGLWDDTRIESGRVYRDSFGQPGMKLFYFGLPTNDSFNGGAIGIAEMKPGVKFESQTV